MLCRSDAHPTPPASGPQNGGWEPHCLCCQKTSVIIYTGWTRDAQKVSVCLQLWFQAGMSDCVLLDRVGGSGYASGKCGPGSGLAVCVMGCVCVCVSGQVSVWLCVWCLAWCVV